MTPKVSSKVCSIEAIFIQMIHYKKALIWGNVIAIVATLLVVMIPLFIPC
ncbi:MAG: hypothetical protein Q9M36_12850 [Sulfurovum sp.]|nr:hypothetical protein [Sulfurovum sp.]